MPKFFLWDLPKHMVVEPRGKACKYCWENRGKFGGGCKRQAEELTLRAKRAGKVLGRPRIEVDQHKVDQTIAQGLSVRKTAALLGITPSKVQRLQRERRRLGPDGRRHHRWCRSRGHDR